MARTSRLPLHIPTLALADTVPAWNRHQALFPPAEVSLQSYPRDSHSNVPPSLIPRLSPTPVLPYTPHHPLELLRTHIESHLSPAGIEPVLPPSPVVTTKLNFDDLGFPADHPGRAKSDTYYLNKETCLRTHTSAHEVATFASGKDKWLMTADVYRRDEIDASHYPVFHQMEGASVWSVDKGDAFAPGGEVEKECEAMERDLAQASIEIEDKVSLDEAGGWQPSHQGDPAKLRAAELSLRHLKGTLNGLALSLFGPRHAASSSTGSDEPLRVRWIPATFPFTSPSYEVEVWYRGAWLEILGCGVVMQRTLDGAGEAGKGKLGWAFGLGLERIAMVLYSIPDIRLFWSRDERFLRQFRVAEEGQVGKLRGDVKGSAGGLSKKREKLITFEPFSRYPPCYKDVSFWTTSSKTSWHENDLMELIREETSPSSVEATTASDGSLVESVSLIDSFVHPKTGRESRCYRLNYRSMERSLSNAEVNEVHERVVERMKRDLGIEVR
ncbi:phenylalanyl-tRNA synthetase [Jaminaea rosea]|uniref:phenylalanine--tRNA ligase n=1 Tax=Jaminaea rosea TaxID=1569628 RepID=A0A316UV61_9BASI|nr:phenylalanyl-tRNA synthetase [Jaminaea rosea]PWN27803.1 phenylalanyl-tRNA synthetase [Jaminaea rosea]